MKLLIDFLPILIFFVAYKIHGIYTATAALIVVSVLVMGWQYWQARRVETMTLVSTLLVLVFGGATLWLHNDFFIKIKPSILYALFGFAFLYTHWRGRPLVERLMGGQIPASLPATFWRRLNVYWIGFFLGAAALNLLVAFTMPTGLWVDFKLFGLLSLTVAFVLFQAMLIARALPKGEETAGETPED